MSRWCASLHAGTDFDVLFAYNTIKYVRVVDRRLGLLRLFLMLGIIFYIVGFVLIMNRGYMKWETPVGSVQYSLQPQPNQIFDATSTPYCQNYTGTSTEYSVDHRRRCKAVSGAEAVFPTDATNSMLVATRVKEYQVVENQNCSALWKAQGSCGGQDHPISSRTGARETYFFAGVEEYTILLQHSMQAPLLFQKTRDSTYSKSSNQMTGQLIRTDGSVLIDFGDSADIITVGQFLEAAEVSLAAPSTNTFANGEPVRTEGITVVVTIDYSNFDDIDNPVYRYYATAIAGSNAKSTQVFDADGNTRTVHDRHGVRFVFAQTGRIGAFDIQTTLIQLVTSLGLISVATILVDLIMLKLLPHKKKYGEYKYEVTQDFSDIRDAETAQIVARQDSQKFGTDLNFQLKFARDQAQEPYQLKNRQSLDNTPRRT